MKKLHIRLKQDDVLIVTRNGRFLGTVLTDGEIQPTTFSCVNGKLHSEYVKEGFTTLETQ